MVKESQNHNLPKGNKTPMLEEHAANAVLENQQVEHDQINQFDSVEKQVFEQKMLEMESLLRAVVHENTNLRALLEGLEIQKRCRIHL